jgi:hypothetical protein
VQKVSLPKPTTIFAYFSITFVFPVPLKLAFFDPHSFLSNDMEVLYFCPDETGK